MAKKRKKKKAKIMKIARDALIQILAGTVTGVILLAVEHFFF